MDADLIHSLARQASRFTGIPYRECIGPIAGGYEKVMAREGKTRVNYCCFLCKNENRRPWKEFLVNDSWFDTLPLMDSLESKYEREVALNESLDVVEHATRLLTPQEKIDLDFLVSFGIRGGARESGKTVGYMRAVKRNLGRKIDINDLIESE